MLFIEGIGYVDEASYIPESKKVNTNDQINQTADNPFSTILAEETEKLSDNKQSLESIFREAADRYGISYDLLVAVGFNESGFNPKAVSSAGAMGIMQLMPSTAKSLGITDAYNAYDNIMGGAKILKSFYDLYDGNLNLMLAAYNAGPGNVEKYNGVPPFEGVKAYIDKIRTSLENGVNVPGVIVSTGNHTFATSTTNSSNKTDAPSSTVNPSSSHQTATTISEAYKWMSNQTNNYSQIANKIIANTLSNNSLFGSNNINTTSNTLLDGSNLLKTTLSEFSYEEYELLVQYFDTMMEIIASIGGSENDNDSNNNMQNNSLMDLYKLSNSKNASLNYNWNNIL